jgi:hypothetical protein
MLLRAIRNASDMAVRVSVRSIGQIGVAISIDDGASAGKCGEERSNRGFGNIGHHVLFGLACRSEEHVEDGLFFCVGQSSSE